MTIQECSRKFQFAIDRGGTFTDVYAKCPDGRVKVMKLLSVDPANYDDAPREGIRRILQEAREVKQVAPRELIYTFKSRYLKNIKNISVNKLFVLKLTQRQPLPLIGGYTVTVNL